MNQPALTSEAKHASPGSERGRTQTIRVGLIGCGAIAEQMHLPVLAGHPALRLTVLVDRDRRRAERFAAGYGVPLVLEDASSLSREAIDAAIVATPPIHHAPCAIELLRKGIHVLVEKPMATTLADAETMVAEAERAGAVLSVGFFRRMFPSVGLMRSLIDSGWMGRPLSFLVEGGGMYNWSATTLGNMRRDQAGGGVLFDFGSHMIDLLLAIVPGKPKVLEYRDNSLGGVEADCEIGMELKHRGLRIPGRIDLARTRERQSFVRVECERAAFEFRVTDRFDVTVSPRAGLSDAATGKPREFILQAKWPDEIVEESWYATFARQFDDWLEAIRTGHEPTLSGRSALASARLIDECYRMRRSLVEPWVTRGTTAGRRFAAAANEEQSNGRAKSSHVHVQQKRSRVLVTGASGFIGCRVVELLNLREQCEVRAAVHNPANASRLARLDVEMVQADSASPGDARRLVEGCDSIIHCAIGTTYGEPRRIASVTVGGTRQLVEAALDAGIARFVHVSSMSVYGDGREKDGLITESLPVAPLRHDSYGESKAAAEGAVLAGARQGLATVILRPARVFGPWSRTFVIGPLRAIAANSFAWQGVPDVPADLVYVDNVAEALLAATFAERQLVSGEAFNIGAGDGATWREFYEYFARGIGIDLADVAVLDAQPSNGRSAFGSLASFPAEVVRGIDDVVTSPEFKSLGRRVLATKAIGAIPRAAIERFPVVERGLRRMVGADDSLPIFHLENASSEPLICMGSNGARLSNDKLQEHIGFEPPVSTEEALQLTLDWVRHARIV